MNAPVLTLRPPGPDDGTGVWDLVRATGVLDVNSAYAYVLICDHHRSTSVVATRGDEVVGFVTGWRIPERPDTWFVWQVGVAAAGRGQGLAGRMLDHVLARPEHADVRWLETTVDPGNTASRALFAGFARRRDAEVAITDGYPPSLFPEAHAHEELLRIGPLQES